MIKYSRQHRTKIVVQMRGKAVRRALCGVTYHSFFTKSICTFEFCQWWHFKWRIYLPLPTAFFILRQKGNFYAKKNNNGSIACFCGIFSVMLSRVAVR